MYFPIGWSKTLKIRLKSNESLAGASATDGQPHDDEHSDEKLPLGDEKLLSIKASSDKSFLCVLTNFSLRIWFCKVNYFLVLLILFALADSGLLEKQATRTSKQFKSFKPNSSMLARTARSNSFS